MSLLVVAAPRLANAQRRQPAVAAKRPAVKVARENYVYPLTKPLSGLDFANLDYQVDGEKLRLKNGAFNHEEPGNFYSLKLEHVWPFDIESGQARHTLVFLDHGFGGASSNDEGLLLVFGMQAGHPAVVQRLTYDRQAAGEGVAFDPATGKLTIKARSDDDSPHCCARSLDLVTFVWSPSGFTQTAARAVPIAQR